MPQALLAIDVGGSTSRAYLVDVTGRCLGHGRDRGGNPASNDPEFAASSIIAAVDAAVADAGGGPFDIIVALIALAGPQTQVAMGRLETAFRAAGLTGRIVFAGDLLAMFASITPAASGYCVVAGTGAGAVRIRAGEIEKVVDAAGWLLGDSGSGYWLGLQAARAVVAELEGHGETTVLTPALLEAFAIQWSAEEKHGRPLHLRALIDAVYGLRPIELARFAPLVVAHRGDPVAAKLIAEAERYLVTDFAKVFDTALPGPIALGGGVMPHLPGVPTGIAALVRAAGHTPDIHLAADGGVGSIVLAMRAVGITVDEAMFKSIAVSISERRGGSQVSA